MITILTKVFHLEISQQAGGIFNIHLIQKPTSVRLFVIHRQYVGGGYVRKLVKHQTRSGVSLQDGED